MVKRWLGDRRGATAIEYALIAAVVAIACVGGLSQMGTSNGGLWGRVQTAFTTYIN